MFDRKSIYALNKKDPEAIIYLDAGGNVRRLTREDFSSDEEFRRWKVWSDENYHIAEKEGHVFANHTLSLLALSDEAAVPPPDAELLDEQNEQERTRLHRQLREAMDACLTPTQRRRLWLYSVERMTIEQIAAAENVRHQNVSKSITAAKKKIRTFFEKQGAKTPF